MSLPDNHHESERLDALRAYAILDTPPERGFDDLVMLAAQVCQASMAVIGFIDAERYWVKAQYGLRLDTMPRQFTLFPDATPSEVVAVSDTLADSRLVDHPMVTLWPKVRYYVGVPLITSAEQLLGVLEVMDVVPHTLDQRQLDGLAAVARQVMAQLELRLALAERATVADRIQHASDEMSTAFDATLASIARALDLRDREVPGHLQRVADITVRLAQAMALPADQLAHLRRGALLHDIGKMGIADSILLKPSALTDDEWAVMHQHPTYAYDMLSPIEVLRPALDIPYCHHERWDGQGYPRGLRHTEIPLAARIFSVVDVWDALRSDRPYRQGWPDLRVRDYISKRAGADFDPDVVENFLKLKV
jgi:response regulator RpfG family c-di-GMP phosphodiesterase